MAESAAAWLTRPTRDIQTMGGSIRILFYRSEDRQMLFNIIIQVRFLHAHIRMNLKGRKKEIS